MLEKIMAIAERGAVNIGEQARSLLELQAMGEEIAERQGLEFNESVVNHELGAAVVLGQWGKELVGPEEKNRAIEKHLVEMGVEGIGRSYSDITGFEKSWWSEKFNYEELLPFQIELARQSLLKVLEPFNLDPKQLTRFGVASTTPFSMGLARDVARTLGISEEVPTEVSAAACNSTGLLYDQFLQESSDNSGLQVIVAFEMLMAFRFQIFEPWFDEEMVAEFYRGITDRGTLSFFSDRVSAMVFDPSRFRVLARATHGVKDEKGVLGAVNTVPFEGEEVEGYDGLVLRNEDGYVAYLPDPRPDQAGYINPMGTTKFIVKLLRDLVGKFKDVAAENGVNYRDSDYALFHHPSKLIHKKLGRLLGLPEGLAPWSEEHCNAPACTFGMEFARVLADLKLGDRILSVFFGAGGQGQINLVEVV